MKLWELWETGMLVDSRKVCVCPTACLGGHAVLTGPYNGSML